MKLSQQRIQRSVLILYLGVLGLLLWLVLYPNLYVFVQSLKRGGHFTFANYHEFFLNPSQIEALRNSLLISLGSVVLSAAVGVPLAFIFHLYDFPARRIFAGLASLPVLLPPLVGVISFMFLYGESGILSRTLQQGFGLKEPPIALRGVWAILFVHAYTMYVYFYLFASAGLKRLDFSLVEASRSLGASRVRTFFRVTLRLLTPSLMGASLLTFMTSMASFSAPYIFGGGIRVLALQIYNSKLNGDLEMALVETVILTATSIFFLILLRRYEGTDLYRSVSKGTQRPLEVIQGRFLRIVLGVAGILIVLLSTVASLHTDPRQFFEGWNLDHGNSPSELHHRELSATLFHTQFLEPIFNSLKMAGLATAGNAIFALLAGYLIVRKRVRGGLLLGSLILLPWALPGTVLGLSLATTFNQYRPLQGRLLLVGTYWILPLAYFIRNIPVVVRSVQASFEQFDPALEEAARSLGATWLYSFRRVVLPMVLPGVVSGALLAFVAALGEFVTSIVIYTIHNRPISIEILAQLRQFNFGSAAAYGVLLVVMIAAVFLLSEKYSSDSARPGVG